MVHSSQDAWVGPWGVALSESVSRGRHLGEEDVLKRAAGLLEGLDHGGQHVSNGHVAIGGITYGRPHILQSNGYLSAGGLYRKAPVCWLALVAATLARATWEKHMPTVASDCLKPT